MNFDLRLALAIMFVVAAIAVIAFIFAPRPLQVSDADRAMYACIFLCKSWRDQGMNLDNGPCLSSGSDAWELDDWVCDVAHWPRQAVDNQPGSQCPEYGETASHFVEVSPACDFIRAV
jgi:hypothetical protein